MEFSTRNRKVSFKMDQIDIVDSLARGAELGEVLSK